MTDTTTLEAATAGSRKPAPLRSADRHAARRAPGPGLEHGHHAGPPRCARATSSPPSRRARTAQSGAAPATAPAQRAEQTARREAHRAGPGPARGDAGPSAARQRTVRTADSRTARTRQERGGQQGSGQQDREDRADREAPASREAEQRQRPPGHPARPCGLPRRGRQPPGRPGWRHPPGRPGRGHPPEPRRPRRNRGDGQPPGQPAGHRQDSQDNRQDSQGCREPPGQPRSRRQPGRSTTRRAAVGRRRRNRGRNRDKRRTAAAHSARLSRTEPQIERGRRAGARGRHPRHPRQLRLRAHHRLPARQQRHLRPAAAWSRGTACARATPSPVDQGHPRGRGPQQQAVAPEVHAAGAPRHDQRA